MTAEALLGVLAAEGAVRWRGRGSAVSHRPSSAGDADEHRAAGSAGPKAGVSDAVSGADARGGADLGEARRVARVRDRACGLLPWQPTCLVRALALERLLRRRGFEGAEVRIGVRRQDGGFSAHAWVECGGEIVGDPVERVGEYRSLPGIDVFPE